MANNEFTDWLKAHFDPRAFDNIAALFPRMHFTQGHRGVWNSPYKLDGSTPKHPRRDKCYITPTMPHLVSEQGGETVTLVELYARANGLTKGNALRAMATALGLELPHGNSDDWQAQQAQAERLQVVTNSMAKALRRNETPTAQAVTAYLREKRGYSPEYIEYLSSEGLCGCIDPETANELRGLLGGTFNAAIGRTHTLAIPYLSNGRIVGFCVRSIETAHPKYLYAFAEGYSQRDNLAYLRPLPYKADAKGLRSLVAVEGQLDALAAAYIGLGNVVAIGGLGLSREALQGAKKRQIEAVIIATDSDKEARDTKRIGSMATACAAVGLRCFVADLPAGGKDIDELATKGAGESVLAAVNTAMPVAVWLYNRIATEYQGDTCHAETEGLKRRVYELCQAPYTSPTDTGLILRALSDKTGNIYTVEALEQELQAQALELQAQANGRALAMLLGNAARLNTEGKASEAIGLVSEGIATLKAKQNAADYSGLLAPQPVLSIFKRLAGMNTGLPTQYTTKTPNGEICPLKLSVGLTYVCGLAGHGKSRLLANLALYQAGTATEGETVLYITLEEPEANVLLQLANIYANTAYTHTGEGETQTSNANIGISINNLRTLQTYYTTGETQYFSAGTFQRYKAKEKAFFGLAESNRLRVLHEGYNVERIEDIIRFFAANTKLKAVFVDYVQLLKIPNTRLTKREELGEIAQRLWACANDCKAPIVLAAQFNRDTPSPVDMHPQNIAEAADLERSAHTIIGLWNSAYSPTSTKQTYYQGGGLSSDGQRIEALGLGLGSVGRMYIKVLKCRAAPPNSEAVLDFDGNTGAITHSPIDALTAPTTSGGNEFPKNMFSV